MTRTKPIVNFIFEVFSLKKILRSSYQTIGEKSGTIAEHSFLTAIIGYCLAKIEKADENKVVKMCLFHDLVETRTGDANFPQKRYQLLFEEKAIKDITQNLPDDMKSEIVDLYLEFERGKSKEAMVSKEADKLEQLFQEKKHIETGNQEAERWFKYSLKNLKLKSAKNIGKAVSKSKSSDWWAPLSQKLPIKDSKKIYALLKKILG